MVAIMEPMEARLAEALPQGPGWQFEPKWDGFRCLALREGGQTQLLSKAGKPLARYFPEMAEVIAAIGEDGFVLDGELAIADGGTLSFEALQMRLHPAESRVRRLAAATPSMLIVFDLLARGGEPLANRPLSVRRKALEGFHRKWGGPALRLSPFTTDRAEAVEWLDHLGASLDGVVAKRRDAPYAPGERAMVKVKRLRTADCVVGGFRYLADRRLVGSLLLGLYDDGGRLNHVGFTSGLAEHERPALTKRLEALVEPPGFTGAAPGGPSRWSTERSAAWSPLRPGLVVEVRYDHVTGERFRHGTGFVRWRPDKAPRQCRMEQLHGEAAPDSVIAAVVG